MEMVGARDCTAVSPGRRRGFCNMEGDQGVETKCIKRRRRDTLAVGLSSNDQQLAVDVQRRQGDQTAAPAATTVKRSSRFRGVSRHRWTGRYEAHLWDKGSWNPTQRKKGKQVYLGAYDDEESAARAYDLAALKYWGTSTFTNFPVPEYEKELEMMKNMTKEEYLASLRRRSSGFSRGVSKYRGVARHHHNGRWEARIGRVFGNKYLYLGTYSTQEEAAHAYDIAAIEYRGINAVTNFDLSTYIRWLKPEAYASPPQESKSPLLPPPVAALSNLIPMEKPNRFSTLYHSTSSYMMDDLNKTRKQEDSFQIKAPSSPPRAKSSPTALGLLLKSSIFKELVEKNLNNTTATMEEQNEAKIYPPMSNDNLVIRDMFYDGISRSPYMCPSSSSRDIMFSKQENDGSEPLYNNSRLDQSPWNGTF